MKIFFKPMKIFSLLAITAINSSTLMAAEFFYEKSSAYNVGNSLSIRGEIKSGDYERFRNFLLEGENLSAFTTAIYLNSTGGDVVESLKFANLLERSSVYTIVGMYSKCYSSCFIIFSSGVDRAVYPTAELGVHRISLLNTENDIRRAKDLINPLSSNVYDYLYKQGIPRDILDKMNDTPSSDLYTIDSTSIVQNKWYRSISSNPIFFDTTIKACGKIPDDTPEKSTSEKKRNIEEMQIMLSWISCKNELRLTNTIKFIHSEFTKIKSGNDSILFSNEKLSKATLAVESLTKRYK